MKKKLNIFHLRHFSPLPSHVHLCLCLRTAFSYILPVFPKFSLKIVLVSMSYFPSHNIAMDIDWGWLFNKRLANTFSSGQPFSTIPALFLQDLFAFCVLSNRKRVLDAYYLQVQMLKQVPISSLVRKGLQSHTQGDPSSGAYCRENVSLVNLLPESDGEVQA